MFERGWVGGKRGNYVVGVFIFRDGVSLLLGLWVGVGRGEGWKVGFVEIVIFRIKRE